MLTGGNGPFGTTAQADAVQSDDHIDQEIDQLPQATHETLLDNLRKYAPPVLGVPYVQLLIDGESFAVRSLSLVSQRAESVTNTVI